MRTERSSSASVQVWKELQTVWLGRTDSFGEEEKATLSAAVAKSDITASEAKTIARESLVNHVKQNHYEILESIDSGAAAHIKKENELRTAVNNSVPGATEEKFEKQYEKTEEYLNELAAKGNNQVHLYLKHSGVILQAHRKRDYSDTVTINEVQYNAKESWDAIYDIAYNAWLKRINTATIKRDNAGDWKPSIVEGANMEENSVRKPTTPPPPEPISTSIAVPKSVAAAETVSEQREPEQVTSAVPDHQQHNEQIAPKSDIKGEEITTEAGVFKEIGKTGVFVLYVKEPFNFEKSMQLLEKSGLEALPYQKMLSLADNTAEIKEELKGKIFNVAGSGPDSTGDYFLHENDELEYLSDRSKANIEKRVYVSGAHGWKLYLAIRNDEDMQMSGFRYIIWDGTRIGNTSVDCIVGVKKGSYESR